MSDTAMTPERLAEIQEHADHQVYRVPFYARDVDPLPDVRDLLSAIRTLQARERALMTAIEESIDMIANCAGVPSNPDSLPQMILWHLKRALASKG